MATSIGPIFPVVGVGASAGGLAAFNAFFSGMPVATHLDMAFVLVQHLAPDHKSHLPDFIRRCTRMQVFEVENGMLAGIGTLFLDHRLRILQFTPAASVIINLIGSDVGRPVTHLASNLVGYTSLQKDVRAVLDTLVPLEVQVQTIEGKSYTMSIQPYRTLENVIEGAVISFVDVTEIEKTRESLRQANELLREAALTTLSRLSRTKVLESYSTQRLTKSGLCVEVSIISTALINESGKIYAIATTERVRGNEAS